MTLNLKTFEVESKLLLSCTKRMNITFIGVRGVGEGEGGGGG